MRLISSLLVATLAATTLTTSLAAACGGYVRVDPAPRILAISTHGLMMNGHWTDRSFVVLEQAVQLEAKMWKPLAPGTYDGTQIASLAPLASPMELTLVGPSGTRVVKTAKQVALSRSWQIGTDQSRTALEVPFRDHDQFTIALPGNVTAAKWRELDYQQARATTTWWLQKQGIKDAEYVAIRTVQGTYVDVIEFSVAGTSQLIVRKGNKVLGAATGNSLGVVSTGGRSFLVVRADNQLGTLELPALPQLRDEATARS